MPLIRYIKSAALTSILSFSFFANATESKSGILAGDNFVTLKLGVVQPTSLGGNTGLNTGGTTYSTGILIGKKFMDRFALDLEYMYRGDNTAKSYSAAAQPNNSASNSWSMKSNMFMLNASVDLIKNDQFEPYVRFGLGVSRNSSSNYTSSRADSGTTYVSTYSGKTVNKFAWQAGAGTSFKTTETIDIQLEYMFVDRGKVETKANYTSSPGGIVAAPSISGKLKEHVLTMGLKVKF